MDRNALHSLEWEARRLRSEHVRDLLSKLAISLDLRLRRLAHRLASGLRYN